MYNHVDSNSIVNSDYKKFLKKVDVNLTDFKPCQKIPVTTRQIRGIFSKKSSLWNKTHTTF